MTQSTQLWKVIDADGSPYEIQIWAKDQTEFSRACHTRSIVVTDIIERPINDVSDFDRLLDAVLTPEEVD